MSDTDEDSAWLRGARRVALSGHAQKRRSVGHYCAGDIEFIDAIKSALGPEQFAGYCRGNAMKYLWRYPLKGTPVADLQKARTYLDWLIESLEEGGLCSNPTSRNTG